MKFIDDIDFAAGTARGGVDFFAQVPDVIDAAIAGCIYLNDVHGAVFSYSFAHVAGVAGFSLAFVGQTVDGFSQDAGSTGLAGAAGSAKEVSVGDISGFEGIEKRLSHMLLTHQFRQSLRPPFAVKYL